MSDSSKIWRAEGVLLGAAAGDALGWPQELRGGIVGGKKARREIEPQPRYRSWTRNGGSRFSGTYKDPVAAGEYSDDTQLICALSRAYLHGDEWFDWFTRIELPAWKLYQRGGGRAVLAAASAWSERRPPWYAENSTRSRESVQRYREAGGNGAAMRVAPHVLARQNDESMLHAVLLDAASTHGHPRALVGALVYASALAAALTADQTIGYGDLIEAARHGLRSPDWVEYALRDLHFFDGIEVADFLRRWEIANDEVLDKFDRVGRAVRRGAMANDSSVLEEIGAIGREGGAGTTTAAAAIYLASRGAARPLSGLLAAAFVDEADTDTLASMVGGLLGAVHGSRWLGDLTGVQDADYLREIARALAGGAGHYGLWHDVNPPHASRELIARLPHLERGDRGLFPDGREFEVDAIGVLPSSDFLRGRFRLSDGQTVYVDSRIRDRADARARDAAPAVPPPRSAKIDARIRIVLEAADLGRAARFYSGLLAKDTVIRDGEFELTPGVVIRQGASKSSPADGALVDVRVDDLARVAAFLGATVDRSGAEAEVRGSDPDGRRLRLRQFRG